MSHRFLHYTMAFLMSMFVAVGMLAVPLLATQIGSSNLELGIIGCSAAGVYALVVVSAGAVSDKFGRKRVIIIGALLTGLAYALMPLSRAPTHLVVLMIVCGCGMASFWPVLEAWMSEEGGAEEIRRELGAFNVSWSVGNAIGPLLAGLIYTISSTLSFLFAAAGALSLVFLAALHRKPAVSPGSSNSEEKFALVERNPEPVKRSILYAAWMANFASWFAISEIRVLFPKLGLELGMQPWMIGTILFSLGLALTVMFYIMAKTGRWHNTAAPLLSAQALIVVMLAALIGLESPIAFMIVFAGLGIGFGVTYSYSLYCSVVGSLNKGAASGRHEMALGIGAFLGPLMGGALAEIFRAPRAPYILAVGLVLAAMIAESVMLLSMRNREARNSAA